MSNNDVGIDALSVSKNKYWDIIILVLSIYVLLELAIEIIYPFSQDSIKIINTIDFIICLIFLGDFFYFLHKSDDKKIYLKKYWIDFIASIPFLSVMRVFRMVRAIRLIRMLRGVKGLISLIRMIGTNKLQNIMISYVVIMTLILMYCSLAFYMFEKDLNDTVTTFFDAFWWGFISLTSVGYGDIFPVTTGGRIVGIILTLLGMGLFSLITAELATILMRFSKKENEQK